MDRTQISQLIVFATVAQAGSFRAAADQLGIAPSAVSYAISTLESSVGLRLLARTTRSTKPTEEGERLLARVISPLAEIERGLSEVVEGAGVPSGPLRLAMPLLAVQEVIMRRLPEFTALYPDIEIDIRTSDVFENIVEKGCDAGIRFGESLEADMIAVRAGHPRRSLIVGAPAYFSKHPKPRHPRDLAAHNCIRRRFEGGRTYRWELEHEGHPTSVEVKGNVILPQQALIRQAAVDGIGLAFLFEEIVADDICAGRLISVMEDWCPYFDGFYIYYPSRRQMRPALRAFIEFFRYDVVSGQEVPHAISAT